MMALWNRLERIVVGIFGLCALAVGAFQVIGRYIDQRFAFPYSEEVVIYLTVWGVFLASSQLVRTDGHVRPDLVLRLLPSSWQRWVETGNCCVAIVFCCGLVWYGWQIVSMAYDFDERSATGLEFPMWIYYAAVLAGGALMLARYIMRLSLFLFRFDPATMTIGGQEH